jgi:hypothetical protein
MLRDHGFQYERSSLHVEGNNEECEVSIYHGRRKNAPLGSGAELSARTPKGLSPERD